MLTSVQIALIKSSVPAIEAHGLEITKLMYSRMLADHPELLNIFNLSHQAAGTQQKALAGALALYAQNIDNLGALSGAVKAIAERHATLCVKPEHYQIVGKCLLAAVEKVLGGAASPDLLAAWAAAYQQLADVLIAAEAGIYKEKAEAEGGWSGWRTFDCVNRVEECPGVVSFYFLPADGGQIPAYKAGQYVSLRVYVPGLQVLQPRQYTLSQAKGSGMLRITVKAIRAKGADPAGIVSNQLVNTLKVGNQVELTAPTGTFTIENVKDEHPLVLIAAGIGITPMVAMLEELSVENPLRPVHFLYSTQNKASYPLRATVDGVMKGFPKGAKAIFFTQPGPDDHLGQDFDASGRITPANIRNFCQDPDADFYICGPASFMKDITEALKQIGVIEPRIHTESFGA